MPLPPSNLLADETSPYLQQHRNNPVHWRPWSPASLAEARELDKPILLSVGYAACHWCHVMAHESFEDAEIAALMNRLYINIKVDREERPDIDQIYMAALNATGEQGGWPLTMFLTPDAKPFWGGTYFPKEPRYGRPGFAQVLEAINRAWNEKKESINQSAEALTRHVGARLAASRQPSPIEPASLAALADSIFGMIDREEGGLRGAPKFPNAPFMEVLWLNWLATGNSAHRDAVLSSLRHMLNGGIYDHIGGGLSRYSTDASWLIPHFEKMLYDNAQLIRICNWAYAETGEKLFQVRIEETIAWLLREMCIAGGFASSLDADSEGEEGLFYTWDRNEIAEVLGPDSEAFLAEYSLSAPDHWEGKPVLHRNPADVAANDAQLRIMRENLLDARGKRVRPGRDDKILADWNGLAISAIAEAGRLFSCADWIEAAEAAFRFVVGSSDGDGRLPHSILGSRRSFPGLSSDYAAMANAAVSLFEATRKPDYAKSAVAFVDMLDRWYRDDNGSGYFLTASDCRDIPVRIRGDVDEATPSATSQIIAAMARTASLSGNSDLQQRVWTIAEAAFGRTLEQHHGQAGIFNACALVLAPIKLVIIEEPDNPAFAAVAKRNPDPRRVDVVVPVGIGAAEINLPGGAPPDTTKAGAWLCTGLACLPVITDPDELERALRRRPST
ncbi:hypothetical protein SAMN04488498_104203 [Mesorhizobium albiziae]|uniref:Spermatogenesis-associated protein 20-like TRX domain-containing protein n=1 Tax=Neomesorhizobium albiziae TaxID=335020 RepID=A0A1I3Y668_9HYPH|nr:thioredoxin domain-containing protein [Mesorhizobium albiziae]GLS30092.1 thioredoxin domain-containing protein [Mesorhizobium albiziae]SFK26781.1 hypothetical protein SAMN04488498_104203 [Mesorhizobium albiziae]